MFGMKMPAYAWVYSMYTRVCVVFDEDCVHESK